MPIQPFLTFYIYLNFTFQAQVAQYQQIIWAICAKFQTEMVDLSLLIFQKNIFTPDFGAFDETGQGFSCGCPNSIMEVEFQHWDHQFYL